MEQMSESDPLFEAKHGAMQVHAVNGAVAIGIAQLIKLPFQAASLILLPRILDPADYGVYAMVDPIMSVSLLLIDFGVSQAVVQSPRLTRGQVSGVFWVQGAYGIALGLLLLAASPFIAGFY